MDGHPALRACFRAPIPEIAQAAALLDAAVTAHLRGQAAQAEAWIRQADMPAVAAWVESILGRNSPYAVIRPAPAPRLAGAPRVPARMPSAQERCQLHARDGFHCRFCGIPVIRQEVRERIRRAYPQALRWGKRNAERHAAFFALWAQYDHLLPHALGGGNELSNMVITCAACNYGRGGYTLAEAGLAHPLEQPPVRSAWDGLERFGRAPPAVGTDAVLPQ
ncbi:HNH endonuclease [Comamonas granuli]|uniref:HNH endonuclease n=1 Tax=Comamonas granuli TaxID=290309 RepID=UPI0005A951A4|nr:HNH endonuclease [Comamonas granuli]